MWNDESQVFARRAHAALPVAESLRTMSSPLRIKTSPLVARQEGLLFLLFCAAGLGLWLYGDLLTGASQLVALSLTVVAIGLLLARIWRGLLGPVLFYDLIRTARRGRYVLLRCIYALVLLAILWTVYLQFSDMLSNLTNVRAGYVRMNRTGGPPIMLTTPAGQAVWVDDFSAARRAALARFAEAFFSMFIVVQLLAVVLLTPAYTAGAIAEEKDRKTLEFLLATDLKDHEIVFSKWIACMANVGILVLTGLPILGLMQLLGGVDPNLVLAGYAVTFLTLVSLASISILVSVNCKKARDAIVLSYLTLLAYVMVSVVCHGLIERVLASPTAFVAFTRTPMGGWMPNPPPARSVAVEYEILALMLKPFTSGNLFIMLAELKDAWNAGTPLTAILPPLVKRYAIFHGIVAFYCIVFAILHMRKTALATPRQKPPKKERTTRRWFRPSLGRQPMVWKELFAEPGMAFSWFGKTIVLVIVFVSLAYPAWIVCMLMFDNDPWRRPLWNRLPGEINTWVRLVGTTVACLTLLGVAVRAAGSVTGERDRQTLDNLLTTPLELRSILYAKWLGSILSARAAWLWLFLVWGIGVVLGGLDPVTLPWLLLMWLVYAAFFACLGQWFSLTSTTTLRATLVTLATLAALTLGHWVPLVFLAPTMRGAASELFTLQAFGLTPPLALSWFAFHGADVTSRGSAMIPRGDPMVILLGIVAGLVLWGLGAVVLWCWNQARFMRLAGRKQRRVPHAKTDMAHSWGP